MPSYGNKTQNILLDIFLNENFLKFYILQSSVKIYDYNFQKILCKRIQKHHTWFALSTSASKISISDDLKTKWDKNIQVLQKGISIHIEVSYSVQWLNTVTQIQQRQIKILTPPECTYMYQTKNTFITGTYTLVWNRNCYVWQALIKKLAIKYK